MCLYYFIYLFLFSPHVQTSSSTSTDAFSFFFCRQERIGRVGDQALAGHDNETEADHSAVAQAEARIEEARIAF